MNIFQVISIIFQNTGNIKKHTVETSSLDQNIISATLIMKQSIIFDLCQLFHFFFINFGSRKPLFCPTRPVAGREASGLKALSAYNRGCRSGFLLSQMTATQCSLARGYTVIICKDNYYSLFRMASSVWRFSCALERAWNQWRTRQL